MMNNISLMIYLSSVAENAKYFLGFSIIAALIVLMIGFSTNVNMDEKKPWDSEEKIRRKKIRHSYIAGTSAWILVAGLFCVVIPSEKTVLLMAASEASEKIVASEQAKVLFKTLEERLRKKE